MEKVAVRRVNLDGVDAKACSSPGRFDEGPANALQARFVQCNRQRLTLLVGQGRRCMREPALRRVNLLAALPGYTTGPLAPGVRQLDCHGDFGMRADRSQCRLQRRLGRIIPESQATRGDAATWLDGGRLNHQ